MTTETPAARCVRVTAKILLLLISIVALQAQQDSRVDIVADLLERFDPTQVTGAVSCELRRPASAGGVKQDALFEHPRGADHPARVEYQLDLPTVASNDLLLLAFEIALADGVKIGPREDGVRFSIELEGRKVFTGESRECRWEAGGIDLASLAGRKVKLALITEAIGNTSFDWAVWGSPRVLHFRNGAVTQAAEPGKMSLPITIGAVAFAVPPQNNFKVRIRPKGAGAPIEYGGSGRQPSGQALHWVVKDFSFPGAPGIEIDWEPKGAKIFAAAYSHRLQFLQLAATRAVITAGETVPVQAQIKNVGRGRLNAGVARVQLQSIDPPIAVPALEPNETWRARWDWKAPAQPGSHNLEILQPHGSVRHSTAVQVLGESQDSHSIENEYLRLEFVRTPGGYAYARVFARQANDWIPAAVWSPLFRIVQRTEAGEQSWEIQPRDVAPGRGTDVKSVRFNGTGRDADGAEWACELSVALKPGVPTARIRYQWKAGKDRTIKSLLGPNLYVGEGTTGSAKTWGLFPGLEYLYGAEPSSNPRDFAPPLADRRTPHPHKVTVPLMAVTIGPDSQSPPEQPERFFTPDSLKDEPIVAKLKGQRSEVRGQGSKLQADCTVALLWDPLQRWDGEHAFPSVRFASPNFDEGMENHRLGIFLPSAPDFVPENADRARESYELRAGKTLTLDATLVVAPGPVNAAVREWLRASGGLPKPNPWPRSFQQELDVCRAGFLKTVWDAPNAKWRHCIDWGSSHAPGFAALLWLDSHLAEDAAARKESRDRVELAVTNMLRDGGAPSLASQANCHIMQWELPFLYGHLAEAIVGADSLVQSLLKTQNADGSWRYEPGNTQQADLGRAGDSVLGTCANRAATLLRYARITGDSAALEAGEKALRFMERFRVPRGGQTWECPMYEPDILAAAYAVRAYHDAFRVTGNERWLQNAVYWAESGVPFVYLWSLSERPMMLGATIPVFGSTFYTHTWLGVPVQWCGLVYAYHVFHLAEELERTALPKTDSPLPLALNFSPADWKRLVELITVGGMHQQFAEGPRIGAYPDSISKFEVRNPAFINPEDILVNVFALKGHDPDVKTARLKLRSGNVVISSGAAIDKLEAAPAGVRFQLTFFPGEYSHALMSGPRPGEVRVNGKPLPQLKAPPRREAGWWWDQKAHRTYLAVLHEGAPVQVEIELESGN